MKVVLLAGGLGTRLSEETDVRPKPMVEIGGYPMIWHIMNIYAAHGLNEFIVCLGYKGGVIKDYFRDFFLRNSDVTFDAGSNQMEIHKPSNFNWKVTLVDTGPDTMTGGRIGRVAEYIGDDETFALTYGDGVADIDIKTLVEFHKTHGRKATVTAVHPPSRFGVLELDGEDVVAFREKMDDDGGWINGGFFVLSRDALDLIKDDQTVWERDPLDALARDGQLKAFFHRGFWHPMDTLRDKNYLNGLWASGKAPWKTWA